MSRSISYSKKRTRAIFLPILLCLTLVLVVSVSGVAHAAGTVTGIVFRDYNANGTKDANEPGVGGVTINAYGAAGTIVATTTSDTAFATLGNYSITWASADTRVRLEFSGLPGIAQQGAFGAGAGSGTSVHFVGTGDVANYGINRPSDYCLATPNLKLVTTCFELGAQTSGGRVVVSHNYDGTGADNTVAVDNQVGTAWGVAYKRAVGATPGIIYVSAAAKRQAEYGPSGRGAIYAIQGGVVTTLATIPNTGTTDHNPVSYPFDSTFFAAPGKESLGDVDISEDGTTLFVVNLNDQQLYSVNIATAAVTAHGVIGNPVCVNGVYRPFGLGVRDGLVYVGGVCTAEDLAGTQADLHAYVFVFNPATNTFAPTPVLNFPLNYPRGCTDIDPTYGNPGAPMACRTTASGSQADWQPWRDTWPNPQNSSGFSPNPGGDQFFAYPEPVLSGIEFDGEDMIVSFHDRMGDQIGYQDNGPDGMATGFPNLLVTVTAGDLLRAGPNGAGGWTIESGAQGTDFGPSTGANAPYSEQGPGNGEFYWADNFSPSATTGHDETITGGITVVPGSGEVAAEVMDPGAFFSAGTAWFNNGTGARNREFTIIPATAPFGKGNGLGDLAALCDSAPVEIGNYVWFDANKNGIQDPNETPLSGITLTLVDSAGNPVIDPATGGIATATTDANGQYIFSNAPTTGSNTASFRYNLPMVSGGSYRVQIDTTQPALATYTVTLTTAGGGANAVRDSNGVLNTVTNIDSTTVTIGTAGQNNHTLDFGFFVGAPITPTPTNTPATPVTPGTPGTPGTPTTGTPPPPNVTISKEVNPPFAMPGDQVRWLITLHNPQSVDANNISFVDNFASQLEVLTATVDTSGGSLAVNGNTVSYNIAVMHPGQTIKVSVLTRIRANTPIPFIINNIVVCNCGTAGSTLSATAKVLSVGSLPATGFEPPWRTPLLVGVGILLVLFGVGTIRALQRRYSSNP